MNEYTVLWKPTAFDALTEIWNGADDRTAVTLAADEIDKRLKMSPSDAGESRGGPDRVLLVKPLGVFFRVSEADCQVWVLQVWTY